MQALKLLLVSFFTLLVPSVALAAINDVRVVLFVLDGCRADLFNEALRAGELPTVARAFVQQGAVFRRALAVFPSATPTGYQAMVSGLFPGHAGIPYLEWFDRERQEEVPFLSLKGRKRINESFHNFYAGDQSRSLFDDLAGHPTAAVMSIFSRGAAVRRPSNPLSAAWPAFVTHRLERLDVVAYRSVRALFRRPPDAVPRFTFVGLLSTDALQHRFGTTDARVRKNLRRFDAFLQEFLTILQTRQLLDSTYIIITGDHGMHDIDGIFDLPQYLRAHGLHPFSHGVARRDEDVYVGLRGLASATLDFAGAAGWQSEPTMEHLRRYPRRDGGTVDVIQSLVTAPEIALLAVRQDAGHVRLYRSDGESLIAIHQMSSTTLPPLRGGSRREGGGVDGTLSPALSLQGRGSSFSYTVVSGNDPLEYRHDVRLRPYTFGKPLTAQQWARLTKDAAYPDAVVQLGQLFADGRAGTMVAIAKPAWGFFHDKAATHGSHMAVDMRVPLVMRGPTIARGSYDLARLVDLYPTMLQWFGLQPVAPIDGHVLPLR